MFHRNFYSKSGRKSCLYNVEHVSSMVKKSWQYICNNITWSWKDIARFTMEKASEGNLPFLECIISLNEKREIVTKVYRKPTHTGQHTHFSSNQPQHVKLSTIKALANRAKFICSDQTSLNRVIIYYKIHAIEWVSIKWHKTIQNTLQNHNSEHKSKELEPLKMFIPYKKGVTEKL